MNPIVMALSYGATFISASAIVGFGGVGGCFWNGYSVALFPQYVCWGGYSFYLFRFTPTRRMGAKLNEYFPSIIRPSFPFPNIQVFIAAVIFIGMPLYAAVVMKGGSRIHRTNLSD